MNRDNRLSPSPLRKERLDFQAVKLKNLPPTRSLENIRMWTDRLKQVKRDSGSSFIESESEEDSITWSYQSDSEELVDLSPLKQRRGARTQHRKRSRTADEADYARKKNAKISAGLNEPRARNVNEISSDKNDYSFMKQRSRQMRLLEATQRYLISRGMLLDPDASSSESELSFETISTYRSSFDTTEMESTCQSASPVPVAILPVTRVNPAVMQLTATVTPVIPRTASAVEKSSAVTDSKAMRVNSAPQIAGAKPNVTPLELSSMLKRQRTQLNLTVKFEDEPPVSSEVLSISPRQNTASSSPRSPKLARVKVSSKEKLVEQPRDAEVSNTNTSPRKKSSLPNLASIGNKAKKLLKRLSSKNLFKGLDKKKNKESAHDETEDQVTRVNSNDTLTPAPLSSSLPSNFFTSRSSPVSPMSSPPNSARKEKSSEVTNNDNTYALNLEVFNSVDPNLVQSELNRKEARRTRLKRMMFTMQRSATLATLQSVKSKKKEAHE
jgi:hypothetical protein